MALTLPSLWHQHLDALTEHDMAQASPVLRALAALSHGLSGPDLVAVVNEWAQEAGIDVDSLKEQWKQHSASLAKSPAPPCPRRTKGKTPTRILLARPSPKLHGKCSRMAELLIAYRDTAKRSSNQLAEQGGIPAWRMSRIMCGKHIPPLEEALHLAGKLDLPLAAVVEAALQNKVWEEGLNMRVSVSTRQGRASTSSQPSKQGGLFSQLSLKETATLSVNEGLSSAIYVEVKLQEEVKKHGLDLAVKVSETVEAEQAPELAQAVPGTACGENKGG